MTKTQLKKIRKNLPKANKYEAINEKLEEDIGKTYSEGTIRQVLFGNRTNDSIVLAAISVGKEHQEKLKSAINSLK